MDTGLYDAVLYPLTPGIRGRSIARLAADYLSLLKPRVVALHLFTAAVSMFLAAKGFPPVKTLALVLAGGGLTAGAANALNCYFDRDLDRHMERTRNRPLPAGRLSPLRAIMCGLGCGAIGLSLLAWVSISAAFLAFGAFASYVLLYTLWLKGKGGAGTVLSSGIGAAPPLIGWLAVTGHMAPAPFILFGIIALWTPPHFWALALSRGEEYSRAGLSVLPGSKPLLWTPGYVVLLVSASLALIPAAHLGIIYTAAAVFLGAVYLILCLRSVHRPGVSPARSLYVYSIIYLAALFGAMMAGLG
jgi:protoheme IX farnesyltransferase